MYCRICGTEENVTYHCKSRQYLCHFCAKDTPRKVSRETFDKAYWGNEPDVPETIKTDFYEDYQRSIHTLKEYIELTQSYL